MSDTSKQGQLGTCDLSITRHTYESCCNYHGEARWTWKPERAIAAATPQQKLNDFQKLATFLNHCDDCGEKVATHGWCDSCWEKRTSESAPAKPSAGMSPEAFWYAWPHKDEVNSHVRRFPYLFSIVFEFALAYHEYRVKEQL